MCTVPGAPILHRNFRTNRYGEKKPGRILGCAQYEKRCLQSCHKYEAEKVQTRVYEEQIIYQGGPRKAVSSDSFTALADNESEKSLADRKVEILCMLKALEISEEEATETPPDYHDSAYMNDKSALRVPVTAKLAFLEQLGLLAIAKAEHQHCDIGDVPEILLGYIEKLSKYNQASNAEVGAAEEILVNAIYRYVRCNVQVEGLSFAFYADCMLDEPETPQYLQIGTIFEEKHPLVERKIDLIDWDGARFLAKHGLTNTSHCCAILMLRFTREDVIAMCSRVTSRCYKERFK